MSLPKMPFLNEKPFGSRDTPGNPFTIMTLNPQTDSRSKGKSLKEKRKGFHISSLAESLWTDKLRRGILRLEKNIPYFDAWSAFLNASGSKIITGVHCFIGANLILPNKQIQNVSIIVCSQSQVTKPSTQKKCNLVNCPSQTEHHFHVADKWEFVERAIQLPIRLFKAASSERMPPTEIKICCNFCQTPSHFNYNGTPFVFRASFLHTFKEKTSPIEFSSTSRTNPLDEGNKIHIPSSSSSSASSSSSHTFQSSGYCNICDGVAQCPHFSTNSNLSSPGIDFVQLILSALELRVDHHQINQCLQNCDSSQLQHLISLRQTSPSLSPVGFPLSSQEPASIYDQSSSNLSTLESPFFSPLGDLFDNVLPFESSDILSTSSDLLDSNPFFLCRNEEEYAQK